MKLARNSGNTALEGELFKKDLLRALYSDFLEDLASTQHSFSISSLWSRISPSGNIYRLNGLNQSRLRHCADLGNQLDDLQQEYQELLGGDTCTPQERAAKLIGALANTKVLGGGAGCDEEFGLSPQATTGFPPLQEFLGDKVDCVFLFQCPGDEDAYRSWYAAQVIGFTCLCIQTWGPILIVISLWFDPKNYLREGSPFSGRLAPFDILCPTRPAADWAAIIMGVLFISFLVHQLKNYSRSEVLDVQKFGRLMAYDSYWSAAASMVNAWCVFWNLIALPLAFWKMETAYNILLGALSLLFLFNLDDLSGAAGSLLGTTDKEFRRAICWHYSLLSQCPITLKDLVNPSATSVNDFWQIAFAEQGRLLRADSKAHGVAETRIAAVADDEQTLLKAAQSFEELIVQQRFSAQGATYRLPSAATGFQVAVWRGIIWILHIMHMAIPLVYVLINKPCPTNQSAHPPGHGHHLQK